MSNFSILRPLNQQFIQYPYWIAQDNQFSYEEKGLLTNLLSFKDSFHKSALARFANNGKRSMERAWKGLIAKGILIAQRFKVNNRFDWSYTVNLEKIARTPKVDYAEIALRHGVSEEVARAITEEAFSMTQASASKLEISVVEIEKIEREKNLLEIEETPIGVIEVSQPVVETEEMPIRVIELSKNVLEKEEMPIPVVEMRPIVQTLPMDLWIPTMEMDAFCNPHFFEKPTISEEKQPIIPSKPTSTPKTEPIVRPKTALPAPEMHSQYATILLQDKKLRNYLQIESPHFEVKPEMIVAFHKRLEMNELQHPNYEKYAQHFRNWLPEFLKYQQMGNQFQSAKKNIRPEKTEKEEKCGTNKAFNILRKKLQNPQSDYMTYQSWVIELSEITENLSDADLAYQKELLATQKAGKLRERYEAFKAKTVPNQ
ncbi:MAG: hypothetical protein RLZZ628_1642 [Bacteroidota bacterium]|jgi:hypothetical protein